MFWNTHIIHKVVASAIMAIMILLLIIFFFVISTHPKSYGYEIQNFIHTNTNSNHASNRFKKKINILTYFSHGKLYELC